MKKKQEKFCTPNSVMIGEAPKVPNFVKSVVLTSSFCCQLRDYVLIILKFDRKQYTIGTLSRAKFEPNRWQGVCTGAPKFLLLVRFGVFWCFYHQSASQTCKKLMWRYLLLQVFYIARSSDETLTYNSVGVITPNFNFLIILFWENMRKSSKIHIKF